MLEIVCFLLNLMITLQHKFVDNIDIASIVIQLGLKYDDQG
jgi:hypothetical protein